MGISLRRLRCRSMGYARNVHANQLARGPMIASLFVCALSVMLRVTASAEPSTTAVIEQFSVGSGIEVRGYDDPPQQAGLHLAEAVAAGLRKRGWQAAVVGAGERPDAQFLVTGRITKINGGSRSKRAILGMGTGHASFRAEGEVRGAGNRVVGTFGDERGSIGRVGYGGGSNEFVVGLCVDRVGDDIAEMIATGRYEGGRPITQAEALPAPGSVTPSREESPSRSAAERLRNLDSLRDQGLLTDKEYQEKRRQIIDGL